LFFISKKYKPLLQKNSLYYAPILNIIFFIFFIDTSIASGAYDKGTATGRGKNEFSITLNPFGIIPYGQNYAVLSYGLSNKTDIVTYFSSHQDGTKSLYIGGFYQFINSKHIDLASALGLRYTNNKNWDIFVPQLLYTFKLTNNYSIGGSIVKVIEGDNFIDKGNAIDITFYSPINFLKKLNPIIEEVYFGIGTFKNTSQKIYKDDLYFHYSIDFIF
jgi:hypothetical protein